MGCVFSEYSKELTVFTNGTAPGQPDPPHLSEATLNSLLLTWIKRPGVDKEFVLQREEENTGHGFLAAYTGPEVCYRVDHLHKSTTYKFRVSIPSIHGHVIRQSQPHLATKQLASEIECLMSLV